MCLYAQTAAIENGFVFVPEEAPWLDDYLSELALFPAGRHDDHVDSTAQVLALGEAPPLVRRNYGLLGGSSQNSMAAVSGS